MLRVPAGLPIVGVWNRSMVRLGMDNVGIAPRAYPTQAPSVQLEDYVLHGSNYLDTQAAGSYNRRPLSPGTSAGQIRPLILVNASGRYLLHMRL